MPSDTDSVRLFSLLPSCSDTSHCLSVNKLLEVKMPRFPYNFIYLPSVSRVKSAKYMAKKKNFCPEPYWTTHLGRFGRYFAGLFWLLLLAQS